VHRKRNRPGAAASLSLPTASRPDGFSPRSINCESQAMAFARVYYSANGSQTHLESGDLHFEAGKALLVLKWRRRNGARVPAECVELDPSKLHRASSNGTIYRYEGRIGER
jgi:hypothetical protein